MTHNQPNFAHLHVHTEYSLIDGIVRIKPLMARAAGMQMPAIAMTDQSNLFAMVKFYRAALSAGVKPILGSEIYLHNEDKPDKPDCLVLLCQDEKGYNNLACLLSKAYIEGQHHGKAICKREWLSGNTEGLIALSAAMRGDIGKALLSSKKAKAEKALSHWQSLFPNRFYIEIQRTDRPREEEYVQAALDLAAEKQVPVVATNDVCFIDASDFEAHEARVCIHDGYVLHDGKRPRLYSEEQFLRSADEMAELFADVPEALQNSIEIMKRCNLRLTLGKNYLPDFPVPEGMTVDDYLKHSSEQGLEKRLAFLYDANATDFAEKRKPYDERLAIELGVISQMGFPGYFLIVADFIQWSKDNGIPVGPGRGSGAGSLVAYALGITDLDPLEFDLLFERFLNPERVSMPDFDIDFCMEGRDRVIEYVAHKYGRESVSQIITFGTMAAKAVVRDVGRVLDHPYGFVDKIAKLIPFEIGMTLDKALKESPDLRTRYDEDEEVRVLIDLAKKLEGVARNAGKHAGGVVISPGALTDFSPIYCEEGSTNYVTQFDKDDVEAVGLVKFDFLGLRTLTIIDWALKTINSRVEKKVDIARIPMDDTASFDLLKACQTTAVFQLESRGMKDLIKRLQPDCFEDIVALVALFRPGPLQSGMVDDFIDRKHGRAKVEYPHPALEPILKPTYGVILYQEQVMQIAQVLASYSLGAADILRRAMGKKKPEEMDKQRKIFTEGAIKNGVEEHVATYIFDLMEKFAGYGFNKSHSAAYALVAYQTAWLKAHYPAEFMAAVLSSDMDNTDKVVIFVEECAAMKLALLPPNINEGEYQFTVNDQGEIVYGLGAIKGVGESALDNMLAVRKSGAPFKSVFDFCCRVDLRKVTKRVLEALIKSGAMDTLGPYRSTMMESMPSILQAAEQVERNKAQNQSDLFAGDHTDDEPTDLVPDYLKVDRWAEKKRLQFEHDTLGFYLSGHPFDLYAHEVRQFTSGSIADLNQYVGNMATVAGLIVGARTMKTKRGRLIAFATIDDTTARVDIAAFSDVYDEYKDLLVKNHIIVVEGEVSVDDYTGGVRMTAKRIWSIDEARSLFAKRLLIDITEQSTQQGFSKQLAKMIEPYKGGKCPIHVRYIKTGAKAVFPLGKDWNVYPRDDLLQVLRKTLSSKEAVKVEY